MFLLATVMYAVPGSRGNHLKLDSVGASQTAANPFLDLVPDRVTFVDSLAGKGARAHLSI